MGVRWVVVLQLIGALVNYSESAETIKPPNIVIIVADDLGYNDVGFQGSNVSTPNLDRLAKEGVILKNHIVSSSCSPTRAALMTGRYPIRTGFWKGNIKPNEEYGLGLDETLLPEMLKRNGYVTHGVGKWHLGMHTWDHTPVRRGFVTWFGMYLMEQNYFTHTCGGKFDFREDHLDEKGELLDNIRTDLTGRYNTRLFTDKAVEIIQDHEVNKPLFLYLAYTAPHLPHQASSADVLKYASYIPDSAQDVGERRQYSAMISVLDEGVGKVEQALSESGIMDNTILLFTSDNGAYHFGSNYPLRGGKRSFMEGGVRGAAFVHSRLLEKQGYTNSNLHHVTDWYVTLQKLVGDQPQKHEKAQLPLDGVDIWGSISRDESCRDEILYELRDPSKRLDTDGKRALKNSAKYPVNLKTFEAKYRKGRLGSGDSQDLFVVRWKNWKLFFGTGLLFQGWTSPSGQRNEYRQFANYGDGTHNWSIVSGTFLFDLATDEREEYNVAQDHPEIVHMLLDKKQGYLTNVKIVPKRLFSGPPGKVWVPWVKL
ncbi:hypothetical protein ACHWQZ_G002699 [Mnemiopsis leidyi]